MKWLKFMVAWMLCPLVWSSIRLLGVVGMGVSGQWDVWGWFLGGAAIWLVWYLFLPRPTWLYVFGHELTHALAIWLSGGKVKSFRVTSQGGMVESDRTSAWIALAPYLVPIYPLLAGIFWLIAVLVWRDAWQWTRWFLFFWGICWAFHFSFTFSLLKTKQPDFESQGFFFSWVMIVLVNVWILILLVCAFSREMSWGALLGMGWNFVREDYVALYSLAVQAIGSFFLLFNSSTS